MVQTLKLIITDARKSVNKVNTSMERNANLAQLDVQLVIRMDYVQNVLKEFTAIFNVKR